MIKLEFDDVLERIISHTGTKNRKELAKELDTHINTFYTWIERKKVPDKELCKFADKNNLSVDWLRKGIGTKELIK